MSPSEVKRRWAHVVILTAIPLEYQAAKQVEAGAWEGSHWEEELGPNGLQVAFRTFLGHGGRPLRVALAQAEDMGSEAATNALLPLVDAYQPRCVAMCGVCAGRAGKTNLGDVVAAERLFFHDTGKRLPGRVEQDLKTYNLRGDWKQALEHLDFSGRFRNEKWWKDRPTPYAWQEHWVLAQLHQGIADPSALPECGVYCPQWEKVIEDLWKTGCVEHGTLTLTDTGRKRIQALLIKHRQRIPDLSPEGTVLPFKVHVAPMGSGRQVVEDEEIWTFISESMRKTLSVEMEAAALGVVAHIQRDKKLDAVVMKGVMDFANHGRDDHFKEFAARASAECLMAFLREHLDVGPVPGVDDILVSGTGTLPENPPPSTLLQARYQVVPFRQQGREEILAELDRWCDEGPPVAVRLIHAEGGVGKTRLAIEWLGRRSPQWASGFLAKGVKEDWFERLCALGQPVVVVVDYAESHPHLRAALLQVLRYAQQEGSSSLRRIRLVLLARNAGDWWQTLCQADAALGAWLNTVPPYELAPLAPQEVDRERVFHEAAEWFAKAQRKAYTPRPIPPLKDEHFERVLYLHMAALAAVEGLEFEANTLMEVVLDHEERFWEAQAQVDDVTYAFRKARARQLVAAATLRGGFADVTTAERVAGRILGHALAEHDQMLLWLLHRVYERKVTDSPVFLPALEPDLLGEGMVLRVASRQGEEGVSADWIDRVFPVEEGIAAVGQGFEVLGRASATKHEVVRPWIEQLLARSLRERARLAFEATKAVGRRTALSVLGDVLADQLEAHGDNSLAVELEAAGIPDRTVVLRRVAEWIQRSRLKGLGVIGEEGALAERARLQNNLGNRLRELGRREEALTATQQAVELYRALVERRPEAFQPALASSLNNLGPMLSELGRREEALTAAQQAVELYRALAERHPDAFHPNLAGSLNNLSPMLSALGRREEALTATQEAMELYRALADHHPEAFQPDLAMSFNNLGTMLSALGRREEALTATQQAVELYRVLAEHHPDAFQADLAGSLNNMGLMLSALGRREEALTATQQAVELYRALAGRHPDAFQADLAGSLNNLGLMLSALGRHEEALTAMQQAMELYRALAERRPEAFQLNLASSLNNLGTMFSALGRREEALTFTQQAVELYRALAERHPDAFQADLAMSLNNLGPVLRELGRHEEALIATQEAMELYRSLAERHPEAFQPDLAMSLNNLGNRLSALGWSEEALTFTQQAVELYRGLAGRHPEAFQPALASSLNNLGNRLSALGRLEEALAATQQAVELYRALAERHPETFQPDLAMSLNNLGTRLRELGRREEALAATQQAVELYRALAERHPQAFHPNLAGSLNNLSPVLSELGRREEALTATQQAFDMIWPLFKRFPPALRNNTEIIIRNLQRNHEALQRPLPPELKERIQEFIRLAGIH